MYRAQSLLPFDTDSHAILDETFLDESSISIPWRPNIDTFKVLAKAKADKVTTPVNDIFSSSNKQIIFRNFLKNISQTTKISKFVWLKLLDIFDEIVDWETITLNPISFSSVASLSDARLLYWYLNAWYWIFSDLDDRHFEWCEAILQVPSQNIKAVMHMACTDLVSLVVWYLESGTQSFNDRTMEIL